MDPINYVQMMQDPTSSVMAGYQTGLDNQAAQQNMQTQAEQLKIQQAQEGRAAEMQPYALQEAQLGIQGQQLQNQATGQAIQAQSEQQERRAAFQADMAALTELGADATLQDFVRIETKYPELAQNIRGSFDAMDDVRRKTVGAILAQGVVALQSGETEMAKDLFEQYAQAAEAADDAGGAASARSMVQMLDVNPDGVLPFAGLALNMLLPETADKLFKNGKDSTVSKSEMVGPTLSVQTMSDGTTRVVDTATNQVLTGQAATDAIADARQSVVDDQRAVNAAREEGKLTSRAGLGGEVKAAEALGTLQAGFVEDALKSSSTVATGMNTITEAIAALDAGGRVGAIDKFLPNITEASASLSNAMDRMGLDVIGSVTFGALSEGELRLAMETAVPRNLGEAELRSWLERKLEAQRKVRVALIEQAQFLSDPQNTINDWTRQIGGGTTAQPQPTGTPQATAQPAAPSAQPSFMNFAGGN
jgi:hypothetical protein